MDIIDMIREVLKNIVSGNITDTQLLSMVLLVLGMGFFANQRRQKEQLQVLQSMNASQDEATSARIKDLAEYKEESTRRITLLETQRETDRIKGIKEREEYQAEISGLKHKLGILEERLKLVTEERDKLVKQLQEQTELSGEALRTLGKLRDALERRERKIDDLEEQIEAKDKQIAALTKERNDLLNKIATITEQMTVLRKRLSDVEKKAAAKKAETGVMVVNEKKETKKEDAA